MPPRRERRGAEDETTLGERVEGDEVPVPNEREARVGADILFVIAPVRLVIIGFFVDVFLRVVVGPRLSPSLIVGRVFVRNQRPELVGATRKRVARAIGPALAAAMLRLFVGPAFAAP